jgi:hypothetical protein
MAALTRDRNTVSAWRGRGVPLKVKAGAVIYKGAVVATDATGFAVPAGDVAGHRVVGVARDTVNNVGQADGAQLVNADKGVFLLNNNGANPVVQATVGGTCLVVDDNTVRASGGTNAVVAGVVDFIDPNGQVGVFIG